ncbi:MAG: hypothetical protein COB85_02675 [Bacteroidetes bacterium]|nr:MAG: hypothetical protein COB85_02675 [Bacteroidota bacterium]
MKKKMKNRALLIFAIISLNIVPIFSQTPSGYLGKRLTVSYNIVSFPRFYTLLFEQELEFRYKHHLEVEYITQRKKSIGVSFSYHNFSTSLLDYEFQNFGTDQNSATSSPVGNRSTIENTSMYFGGFFKLFHSNIAPLGTYSRFGIEQITSNVALQNIVQSDDSTVYIPNIPSQDKYFSMMVTYSIGTQRVIFDKLVVRFSVKSGYVFGGLKQTRLGIVDLFAEDNIFLDAAFETSTNKYNYEYQVVKNSLLNQNIISVTLGLGFLVY